jgi:hypothetical protein
MELRVRRLGASSPSENQVRAPTCAGLGLLKSEETRSAAMAGTTPFTIGADVSCTDGVCGKLSRLVIDPRAGTVTHLVVNDRQFQGRLVPLSLADVDAATGQIRVCCTIAEFGKLDPASRTMLLEGGGADPDIRNQDQLQLRSVGSTYLADPPSVTYDTLPSRGGSCARR